jgi:fibronectin type 3 domain-containing protein
LYLTWDEAPGASGGYNVYRGTYAGGEDDTPVASLDSGATNWTDNSVVMGQAYYYVVTALGCDGSESDDSNEVEATACQTPQNLKAKAANNEIELKWSPSLGATSYTVSRTPAWSYTYNFSDSTQDNHFVDTMVQDSVTYTYQVQAVVSYTEQTDLSIPASATPAGLVTNLTAVEATNGILLNWNSPADAVSFNIYRGQAQGQEDPEYYDSCTDTTYTDTGAAQGISYWYYVSVRRRMEASFFLPVRLALQSQPRQRPSPMGRST